MKSKPNQNLKKVKERFWSEVEYEGEVFDETKSDQENETEPSDEKDNPVQEWLKSSNEDHPEEVSNK